MRNALRLSVLKNLAKPVNSSSTKSQVSRSLWSLCNRSSQGTPASIAVKIHNRSDVGPCGCCKGAHTKAGKELVEFLAEEIVAEKKAQKLKTIPTELDGFKVALDGSEVTLTKKEGGETITINFNVNHTVDTEEEPEVEQRDDTVNVGEMKSKPHFHIDIVKGNQTLGFDCSFNNEPGASGADESFNDIFGIDEITLYEGEHSEKVYAVGGEIIDGYLYDLLMNYLEEKGISNEFGEKMIELSTNYEHSAYISLLEGLSKFTSEK